MNVEMEMVRQAEKTTSNKTSKRHNYMINVINYSGAFFSAAEKKKVRISRERVIIIYASNAVLTRKNEKRWLSRFADHRNRTLPLLFITIAIERFLV